MVQQHATIEVFKSPVGKALDELIQEKKEQSERSAKAFESDFQRFAEMMFNKTIHTLTVKEMESVNFSLLKKYQSMLSDKAPKTINRYISSVKTGLVYLKTTEVIQTDLSFLSLVKSVKGKTEEIEFMPLEIVEEYIAEAENEMNHPELKKLLIMFAVDTGLRLEECLAFTRGQFIVTDGIAHITGYGKGQEKYTDKINLWLYNEIMRVTTATHYDDPIFAPLNKKNITDMMTKIKNKLGYNNRNFSFHSFKKTAVTYAYRLTNDILEAQRKGRHKDLNTTRLYLKEEEYGMTGVYSTMNHDELAYQKVDHETLIKAIGEMGKGFRHLLNVKLNMMDEEEKDQQ